jgi:hypothetical protein
MIDPTRPDPPIGAVTRVMMELSAWVMVPWAIYRSGQALLAIAAGLGLILLPALFCTPGDKKFTPLPTPGRVRLMIELGLGASSVAAASALFGPVGIAAAGVIVMLYLGFGWPRALWLIRTRHP